MGILIFPFSHHKYTAPFLFCILQLFVELFPLCRAESGSALPSSLPLPLAFPPSVRVQQFQSEMLLLSAFVALVRRIDPDILMG